MESHNQEIKRAVNLLKKDPKLGNIIKNVGACDIRVIKNRYEALIDAIITQQISDAAGKAISKRFRELFPQYPQPREVLKTPNSVLRSSGISKMKAEYIKDVSNKIETKEIDFKKLGKKNDEDIILELTKIRGIGRWTAEMFLIFGLGRLDVLPLGDLGLRRGIQKLYYISDSINDEKIIRIAKKWRPYRTIATWYIWRGVRNFKNV